MRRVHQVSKSPFQKLKAGDYSLGQVFWGFFILPYCFMGPLVLIGPTVYSSVMFFMSGHFGLKAPWLLWQLVSVALVLLPFGYFAFITGMIPGVRKKEWLRWPLFTICAVLSLLYLGYSGYAFFMVYM